ncbi:hypothetical protein CR513_05047, partial [Mucuna pruriens]
MDGVQKDEDEEEKVQEIVRFKSEKKPTSSSTEVFSAATKKKNVNFKGLINFTSSKNMKKLSNWGKQKTNKHKLCLLKGHKSEDNSIHCSNGISFNVA